MAKDMARRDFIKCIGKSVLMIILSALVGTALLCIVSLIPKEAIYENTKASVRLMCSEGFGTDILDVEGSALDIYTDSLMINIAYTSAGSLKGTLLASALEGETENALIPIHEQLEGVSDNNKTWNYTRYWHGYLVILKPLLYLNSLTKIRAFNLVFQIALLMAVMILCFLTKRNGINLVIPFAVLWVSMSPVAVASSLQYYSVVYPTLFALIILLCMREKTFYKLWYVFLFVGIFIGFFDLLTFPLVSLAVPLIFYFSIDNSQSNRLAYRLWECVAFSASWCMGYAGMLVMRWTVASIVSGKNIFSEGIHQIMYRTSHAYSGVEYTLLSTTKVNAAIVCNPLTIFAVAFALLFLLVNIKKMKRKADIPSIIVLLVICFYPLVWYFVVMQHSNMHQWMTYRNLCITIYGVMSILYAKLQFDSAAE